MDIDTLFIQAVSTIKRLTELSKLNGIPRPSINDRLNLFGLYSQSTKGDVPNIFLPNNDSSNNYQKYSAWVKYKGLNKLQAREKYINYLIDVLNRTYDINNMNSEVNSLIKSLINEYSKFENNKLSNVNDGKVSVLPRSTSPAASLYRIASSGVNSNLIRPPSRNHSFVKSRKNSVSIETDSNLNTVNAVDIVVNDSTVSKETANTTVDRDEFLKWQGEINNTLLKISTQLNNLQNNNNDVDTINNRSFSGISLFNPLNHINDYKIRTNKDRVSTFKEIDFNPMKKKEDDNNHILKIIYMKFNMLINYLKNKVFIKIRGIDSINGIFDKLVKSSVIIFIIGGLLKRLVGVYLEHNHNQHYSLLQRIREWIGIVYYNTKTVEPRR